MLEAKKKYDPLHVYVRVYIYLFIYGNICIYIYIVTPPPAQDLPGGLYVAGSVSPSKQSAFDFNPTVGLTISLAAILTSRTILTINLCQL